MLRILFLIISCLICCNIGEKVPISKCTDTDPKDACEIHEVRVIPCKEATSNKPCNLKRGKVAKMQIDFTAFERINSMKALPYWAAMSDLPLLGVNNDGCLFTKCPIEQNTTQIFNFRTTMLKTFPRGKFNLKFKFWLDDEHTSKGCCIRFDIKII